MNEIEVGRLLMAAKILDPKMPEADDDGVVLSLWHDQLSDIPNDVAEATLKAHYRSEFYRDTRESISPADIVQAYLDQRRAASATAEAVRERQIELMRRDNPAYRPQPIDADRIHDGVDRALSGLVARRAITAGADPDEASAVAEGEAGMRRLVQSVPCPHPSCHAGAGQRCLGPGGKPLTKTFAHPSRVDAAYNTNPQGA